MKKIGKVRVSLLAMMMLAGITACGSNDEADKSTDNAVETVEDENGDSSDKDDASETDDSAEKADDSSKKSDNSSGGSKIVAGYSLEEINTFDDQDSMMVQRGVLTSSAGDNWYIYKGDGTSFDGSYVSVDNIGDGYVALRKAGSDINSTGLFTLDGEEVIPCEAAIIEWMDYSGYEEKRYMKVTYATEKTTNEDDCYLYSYDGFFTIGGPDEDDVMYKGYAKIYDTKLRRFVGDIESTDKASGCMRQHNDIFTLTSDSDGVTKVYNEDGEVLSEINSNSDVSSSGYFVKREDSYDVYDVTGNKLFSSADSIYCISSTDGYFVKNKDGKDYLIDKNGELVLPDGYDDISNEYYGMVEVKQGDDHIILDLAGNELAKTTEYFNYIEPGYVEYSDGEKYTLVGLDGVIAEQIDSVGENMVVQNGSDVLVINTGKFDLSFGENDIEGVGFGLAKSRDSETGKYGLYDVFTGNQLLDYDFDKIEYVDGYIYAKKEDSWTAYKLNTIYK